MPVDFRRLKFYSMSITRIQRRSAAERSPDMHTITSRCIVAHRDYYYGFIARYFAGYFCCDKCIKPSGIQ